MYEYRIKEVTHLVDGDTFDCVIDLGFDIFHKIRVRMYGMNAPESRTRDLREKAAGLRAKMRLEELLQEKDMTPNYNLILQTKEKGKFGRWLGVVIRRYEDGVDQDVNQIMIDEDHATPYFGGKR
jgi:micrococcal nuclease